MVLCPATPAMRTKPLLTRASQVNAFAKILKSKLLAKDSALAKSYLNLLIDEIVVTDRTATIKGSYNAIARDATKGEIKVGHLEQVPTSISDWCARRDSNS